MHFDENRMATLMQLLEASGMAPQLCDTPVSYVDCGVQAGVPVEPGDVTQGEYLLLPRKLVGWNPVFVIDVRGDSMKDAGLLPGDRLQVQVGATVRDGDIVVACIDGECTVKAYYQDEQEQAWLVPRNENYDAIALTEEMDVWIVGRVVGHMKEAPRTPYGELRRAVQRTRGKRTGADQRIDGNRVAAAIAGVAPSVEHGRQWYAVYRAMVDSRVQEEGDYAGFVALVTRLVPDHGHLPVAKELGRMAVQSFRKPVALWESGNAPVSGQRYHDYLRIARLMGTLLSKGGKAATG